MEQNYRHIEDIFRYYEGFELSEIKKIVLEKLFENSEEDALEVFDNWKNEEDELAFDCNKVVFWNMFCGDYNEILEGVEECEWDLKERGLDELNEYGEPRIEEGNWSYYWYDCGDYVGFDIIDQVRGNVPDLDVFFKDLEDLINTLHEIKDEYNYSYYLEAVENEVGMKEYY